MAGVDETNSFDLNLSRAVHGKELGVCIVDVGVCVSKSVVVVRVGLSIDGHLDFEHVGSSVGWRMTLDKLVADSLGRNVDVIFLAVSESALDVLLAGLLVEAGEACSRDLDDLALLLDVTVGGTDTSDAWGLVVLVGLAAFQVRDIVPLLLIETKLQQHTLRGVNWWHVPVPLVNVEVVRRNLDFFRDWVHAFRVEQSHPESVADVRSAEHVSEALVPLVVGSAGWSSVRVEVCCVRCFVVVEGELLVEIAYNLLLGVLLAIQRERDSRSTWVGCLGSDEGQGLVGDVRRSQFYESKADENSAGGILVESSRVHSDYCTTGLGTESRRDLVDEGVGVVLESAVGVTELAASVQGDKDIEPGTFSAVDDVALFVDQTGRVAVSEGRVNNGGVCEENARFTSVGQHL